MLHCSLPFAQPETRLSIGLRFGELPHLSSKIVVSKPCVSRGTVLLKYEAPVAVRNSKANSSDVVDYCPLVRFCRKIASHKLKRANSVPSNDSPNVHLQAEFHSALNTLWLKLLGWRSRYKDTTNGCTRERFSSVNTTLFHLSTFQFLRSSAQSSLLSLILFVRSGLLAATRRLRP